MNAELFCKWFDQKNVQKVKQFLKKIIYLEDKKYIPWNKSKTMQINKLRPNETRPEI